MQPTTTVLHETLRRNRQSIDFEQIVRLDSYDGTIHGPRLRVLIKKDSYAEQSHARVAAWTPENGWSHVTSIPVDECEIGGYSYTALPKGSGVNDAAYQEILVACLQDAATLVAIARDVV